MKYTTRLKREFFRLYIIEELERNEIIQTLNLTNSAYTELVKVAKNMNKQELSLEDYTKELYRMFIVCVDPREKIELLKLQMSILEKKHKIPKSIEESETINLGDLLNGAQEPNSAS